MPSDRTRPDDTTASCDNPERKETLRRLRELEAELMRLKKAIAEHFAEMDSTPSERKRDKT